jgi:hypothetical protein
VRKNRLPLYSAVAVATLGVAAPDAFAQSQVDASVDVSGNVGYSSNPFLSAGSDTDAVVAQLEVRPALDWRTERDLIRLEGFYTRTEYIDSFDATDAVGAILNASSRLDEQSTLRSVIAFDSSILGTGDVLLARPGGTTVVTPGTPDPSVVPGATAPPPLSGVDELPDGDIDLIGLRQRRNSLSAAVTAELRPDARSTWTFSINAAGADYPGSGRVASSYRSVGVSANYRRSLSERTSVGARAEEYVVDYKAGATSKVYTLQGYASHRLAEFWSFEGSAGISILDADQSLVMFAGQASVCNTQLLAKFCVTGSRAPVVSGFSGVRGQTSLGSSFDATLDAKSSLAGSVTYVWVGEDPQSALGQRRFLALGATYRREIGRRISFFTAVNGRYLDTAGLAARRDASIRAGAVIRFGGRR